MTHTQFPLETSNGWNGLFDAETLEENPRTPIKDQGHAEKSIDNETSNADVLDQDRHLENNNGDSQRTNINVDKMKKTDHDNAEDDDGQKSFGLKCCCCRVFPRTSLLFIGILLPLWTLIFISTFFGIALSAVESPHEVHLNDRFMASRTEILAFSAGAKNFTRRIPQICLEIFLLKSRRENINEITKLIQSIYFNESLYPPPDVINLDDLVLINVTDLDEHMEACGIAADPVADRLISLLIDAYQNLPGALTFNWIRCFDGDIEDFNETSLRPDAQKAYYEKIWEIHQKELYNEFLKDELNRLKRFPELDLTFNATAKFRAFNRSLYEATGGTGCDYNTAASVWFWFTIMTTIGYGNQAPATWQGRGLIFSLGFLSILLFGVILQRAGRVISALFDDLLSHFRLRILSRPWFLCAVWGFIYYGYMIINAYYIKSWKQSRLGESFSLAEGYWFSFISFTTIGLGDIFIEPEVILPKDIVSLPFFYLVGFTFFAAFIENIVECLPKSKKFRLLDALIERNQDRDKGRIR